MPKLRDDVQTNANRIDWRIATIGKPAVLQIDPRHSYFVVERGRPRLPPLRKEGYNGPNNLMPLPSGCVLDDRHVRVYPEHWLTQFLEDQIACQKWGITFRKGIPNVRIYDVIEGLAYAERRIKHILASYETELEALQKSENELRGVLSGPTFLMSDRKLHSLQSALKRTEERKEEIRRILSDRVVRDVNLHFAFDKAQSRLTQMAATVERWEQAIRGNPNQIRVRSVQQMTNPILAELPFFGSKEVRGYTNQVRKAFSVFGAREDTDSFVTLKLAQSLEQVVIVLLTAAEVLNEQADAVPEGEKISAAKLLSGRV